MPGECDEILTPYVGRWVALVRGKVAGVGRTADAARRAAQLSRPKEKPELRFVIVDDWHTQPLPRRLWRLIERHEWEVWLVGGAVRDGLLGRPLHDLDFVVDGDAAGLAKSISRTLDGALVPLDPERGIARVVLQDQAPRVYVDFARRQGENWVADLRKRDFTVNAIAVDASGHYLDPTGGLKDLAAGLLRATHEGVFRDDPLRTLRGLRLMAELDMEIEPQTAAWIQRDALLLSCAASERIRDEFVRILAAPGAAHHLARMEALGLLASFLPELPATRGVEQSHPHQRDVWTHTRMTVQAAEELLDFVAERDTGLRESPVPGWVWGDLEKRLGAYRSELTKHLDRVCSDNRTRQFTFKLGALLHDIGKPQTRSLSDDGRAHFLGHERVGANLAAERLRALRFSNAEVALIHTLVAHHLRPGQLAAPKGPSRRAIYRFFRAVGETGVEICLLSLADRLATWGAQLPSRQWLRQLNLVAALLSAYFDRTEIVAPPPLVNGHQLMEALQLSPGPEVGRLLEAIREAQAAGEVTSQDAALALAANLRGAGPDRVAG